MSDRKLFKIPSASEIEGSHVNPKVDSLFEKYKAANKSNDTAAATADRPSGIDADISKRTVIIQDAPVQSNNTKAFQDNANVTVCSTSAKAIYEDTHTIIPSTSATSTSIFGASSRPSKGAITVSPRQRGNPILKHIRTVPWEYGESVADYELNRTVCALFLSIRYHQLNPDYIHERLKQLGNSFTVRILLVQVDVKESHHALRELSRICILASCTLILAFSVEEAGRYLETFKAFENKPPDLIMEKAEGSHCDRVVDCLTTVRKVNRTDGATLLATFGSFAGIVAASEDAVSLCHGIGKQKAKRLHDAFHEPFRKKKV